METTAVKQNPNQPLTNPNTLRIIAVSDTHGQIINLPEGDIYIHCGDFTQVGSINEIKQFCKYLSTLKFKHKIVIAGNHELGLDQHYNKRRKHLSPEQCNELKQLMKLHCTYLEHEAVEVEGIRIFGSPYTPDFYDWAFMYGPEDAAKYWEIEGKVDILVTHGPPFGIQDKVRNQCVGCPELLEAVFKIKPRYHLFGHIHPGYGHQELEGIGFYNCSQLNDRYVVVNKPFVIDYVKK